MAKKRVTKKVANNTARSRSTKKTSKSSTTGRKKTSVKRRKTTSKSEVPEPTTTAAEPKAPKKKAKSTLTKKELAEFRDLLLAKRAELVGDVLHLTDKSFHKGSSAGESKSNMPIHPADVGSDNWEQEFAIDLIDNERQLLRDIDAALTRLKDGEYGICQATGKPISKKRLRAKPWARFCIEYARKKEQGLLP